MFTKDSYSFQCIRLTLFRFEKVRITLSSHGLINYLSDVPLELPKLLIKRGSDKGTIAWVLQGFMVPSDPEDHVQLKPGDWPVVVVGFFDLQVREETLCLGEPCIIFAGRVTC